MRLRTFPTLFAASVAGALLLAPACGAQQPSKTLADARAGHLQRGVNASMWFAQAPGHYTAERLKTFTTPEDFALMRRMGLDHVRLSIDPVPLTEWMRAGEETPYMRALDSTVQAILANDLSVILDIHPETSFKAPLREGTSSVQSFTLLWSAFAGHYASSDPEHVYFEIMNEPEQDDPYRWQGIEETVAEAIRAVAPRHTIIATAAHYSGVPDLLVSEPLALANVIYTFHDYEPFAFTHQGATWTSTEVRPLRGIPYPSSMEAVAPDFDQEPDLRGKYFLDQYAQGRWDAARIADMVGFAAQWSQLHHVPVYCGEFGVLREYADPAMRAAWLRDTRTALEKDHIGWAMWDYQTNFGMVTKKDGVTTPDLGVLRALGLKDTALQDSAK